MTGAQLGGPGGFRYRIEAMALSACGRCLAAFRQNQRDFIWIVQVQDVPNGDERLAEGFEILVGLSRRDTFLTVDALGMLTEIEPLSGTKHELAKTASSGAWPGFIRASTGGGRIAIAEAYKSWTDQKLDEWSIQRWFPWRRTIAPPENVITLYDDTDGHTIGRVGGVRGGSHPWLSPDGKTLAVQRPDFEIELWDTSPSMPLGWFVLAVGVLALSIAWIARRRVRRVRREAV
jgi:hypothetical protein